MQPLVHVEEVWSTVVSLHLIDRTGTADLPGARDAAVAFVHEVDRVLSTFRSESDLSRWRAGTASLVECEAMVEEVLLLAEAAQHRTSGAFDTRWSGGAPDPTGLVKGWAAERLRSLIAGFGVTDAQVNAGGDVLAAGQRPEGGPWRLGVAHPLHPGQLAAVVEGYDLRVATSGPEHHGHHILRDGSPVLDVVSVTVLGTDLALADAYSTALTAAGPGRDRLAADLDADGWPSLVIDTDGRIRTTPAWPVPPNGGPPH